VSQKTLACFHAANAVTLLLFYPEVEAARQTTTGQQGLEPTHLLTKIPHFLLSFAETALRRLIFNPIYLYYEKLTLV